MLLWPDCRSLWCALLLWPGTVCDQIAFCFISLTGNEASPHWEASRLFDWLTCLFFKLRFNPTFNKQPGMFTLTLSYPFKEVAYQPSLCVYWTRNVAKTLEKCNTRWVYHQWNWRRVVLDGTFFASLSPRTVPKMFCGCLKPSAFPGCSEGTSVPPLITSVPCRPPTMRLIGSLSSVSHPLLKTTLSLDSSTRERQCKTRVLHTYFILPFYLEWFPVLLFLIMFGQSFKLGAVFCIYIFTFSEFPGFPPNVHLHVWMSAAV